ncbi:MAG: hypothetical protein J6B07_00645 [Opitutales bacterium]|nr:hypothetical protein [Opitutales bacterium]
MKRILFYLFVVLFGSSLTFALSGQYKGTLDFGIQKLRIVTEFAQNNKKTLGLLYSIDQSTEAIPMTSVKVKSQKLNFEIKKLGIKFSGKIKDETIEGKFTQFGKTVPLKLTKCKTEINIEDTLEFTIPEHIITELAGTWNGEIKPNIFNKLRLKLVFEKTNKKIKGHIISIDQAQAQIPITNISEKNGKIDIQISSIGIFISTKLEKKTLKGTFKQNNFKQNIKFTKE